MQSLKDLLEIRNFVFDTTKEINHRIISLDDYSSLFKSFDGEIGIISLLKDETIPWKLPRLNIDFPEYGEDKTCEVFGLWKVWEDLGSIEDSPILVEVEREKWTATTMNKIKCIRREGIAVSERSFSFIVSHKFMSKAAHYLPTDFSLHEGTVFAITPEFNICLFSKDLDHRINEIPMKEMANKVLPVGKNVKIVGILDALELKRVLRKLLEKNKEVYLNFKDKLCFSIETKHSQHIDFSWGEKYFDGSVNIKFDLSELISILDYPGIVAFTLENSIKPIAFIDDDHGGLSMLAPCL